MVFTEVASVVLYIYCVFHYKAIAYKLSWGYELINKGLVLYDIS